ncbi:MAG: hypothetical protein C4318_06105 [Acidimicrobiia bacterium]
MTQPYGSGYPQDPNQPPPGVAPGAYQPAPPPPQAPMPPPSGIYQQPAYGYGAPVVVSKPDAPSAQTAMILGLVGLIAAFFSCGLFGLLGIGGIIMAKRAEEEIARSLGTLGGEDKAKIGKITGWIGAILGGLAAVTSVGYLLFIFLVAAF